MIQLLAGLLILAGTIGLQNDKNKAPTVAKIEFCRVETNPAEGLIEADDPTNGDKIYVHKKIELNHKDISSALLDFAPSTRDYMIHFSFTDEGAKKMGALSKQLINKRLAILLDGKVVSAPMITGEFSKHALVRKLKKEDAEKITKAFGDK